VVGAGLRVGGVQGGGQLTGTQVVGDAEDLAERGGEQAVPLETGDVGA